LAPFFINPIEAKSYISGLDFFMGARMHACIAAFSSGVPVFPVSYSRKFFGLFRDSLGYQHLGDLTCVTADEALQEMKKTFVARESIKEEIDSIKKVVINPLYEELMMELKRFLAI
jgi:polysaccharide pyruvyl transferase WcaK-like protein